MLQRGRFPLLLRTVQRARKRQGPAHVQLPERGCQFRHGIQGQQRNRQTQSPVAVLRRLQVRAAGLLHEHADHQEFLGERQDTAGGQDQGLQQRLLCGHGLGRVAGLSSAGGRNPGLLPDRGGYLGHPQPAQLQQEFRRARGQPDGCAGAAQFPERRLHPVLLRLPAGPRQDRLAGLHGQVPCPASGRKLQPQDHRQREERGLDERRGLIFLQGQVPPERKCQHGRVEPVRNEPPLQVPAYLVGGREMDNLRGAVPEEQPETQLSGSQTVLWNPGQCRFRHLS